MGKTIYVQPPIIVKELAQRMDVSLQSIKPEVATFICKKYGFDLVLL